MGDWVLHALDPVLARCSTGCLQFWEMVGTWFAGLATFAAVLVSLFLARRDRIRLRVSAGHRILITVGDMGERPEALVITVKNVGLRQAEVSEVGWRRRPWRSLHALQMFYPQAGYPGPPATIEPGGAHRFVIPLEGAGSGWADDFLRDFVGRPPALSLWLIRVWVTTPVGDVFSARLEPGLREWLTKRAHALRKK